jgi:hypothetical protein
VTRTCFINGGLLLTCAVCCVLCAWGVTLKKIGDKRLFVTSDLARGHACRFLDVGSRQA